MANVFIEKKHGVFSWDALGNIAEGRENLGEEMPVLVYRLLEYTMNHILIEEYGQDRADELFRKAGHLAGSEFAKNLLDLDQDLEGLVDQLQEKLKTLKIGILRIEAFDKEDGSFTLTIAEDLDCSGLPPTDEVVCNYDEGFISGIFEAYTGEPYKVREINCWSNGDRVCRFSGNREAKE